MAAGLCIVASVPPWGWWPLAFVGVALLDGLLAGASMRRRFWRGWLVGAAWMYPGTVWMLDLTPPGYVIAAAFGSTFVALACAAVPPGAGRRIALPGALVLAEAARWSWPFDGIPLATIAHGQAAGPLAPSARIGNALLLVLLVGVGGVALSAALSRRWIHAGLGAGLVVLAVLAAGVAPRAEVVGTFDVAIVQGGGEQNTRDRDTDDREVFEAHYDLSEQIDVPVDVVLWPENVVSVEGTLAENREQEELEDLAERLGAPVIVGTTEGAGDTEFLNASIVILPDGQGERYDKVLRVPFGEFVPLRGLIEPLAGDAGLPRRDARAGTGPAVVDVPLRLDEEVVPMGVVISWEVFFTPRARDGVSNGGEVVLNPTNGSSYWLTIVQSQQVASSRLRALETDRYVVQAAPTGFSAVVSPDGEVLARSRVSDPWLHVATVQRRSGSTLATRYGNLPVLALGLALVGAGWIRARSQQGRRGTVDGPGGDGDGGVATVGAPSDI